MYGIVNKSIEELVVANYGQEKWEDIKAKSNINIEYFISSESYDDDVTFHKMTFTHATNGLMLLSIFHVLMDG
jgi:hypothetical protein